MIFHWRLSDSKSSHVSWTLLRIVTDLNNAVVWIVLVRPLISKSSSPLTKPLRIVPTASITISIIVIFTSHSFLFSSQKVLVFVSLFICFKFRSVARRDAGLLLYFGLLLLWLLFHALSFLCTSVSWWNFIGLSVQIKSVLVSRTFLSILADLNNAVIWRVLIRPSIFNSSSPLSNPFGIVPSASITIDITIIFLNSVIIIIIIYY